MAGITGIIFVATIFTTHAWATPDLYPNFAQYQSVTSNQIYRVVGQSGVWWTSPLGIRCGIDDSGSYGCSGDLPGAPGQNEVAWFTGDPFPRLYNTDTARFSSPANQQVLARNFYIDYRGSRCAVTSDSGVYCINGDDPDSQLLVTSSMVYRGRDAVPSS